VGLVFVGGVHGVGKSTVCAEVAVRLGLPVHSASAVIRSERGLYVPVQGKAVANVDGNQQLLIEGVRKLLELSAGIQLMDGHFALRSTSGKIECISVSVFEQLGIRQVVCIRDAASSILQRLIQRDGYSGSLEEIAALQEAELQHANVVAKRLSVPLHVMSAFDAASLELLLRRVMVEHGT
jgi:adenylate kinase